ncbi:toluene tolerance protein [Pseudomonas oryzihabitans]|uniref:toluene tolerance protein n=1 Tax=Pseudomonas oryzihabitans TaxID=47885 RepID=UPI00147529C3|nr:toluene tolerance protein [Pseudomonas oryzihabitans]NMZ66740.1 toluene tolerance protein [Pseudomonas oryzihabitans]
MRLESIHPAELKDIIEKSVLLEADASGPKVLLTPQKTIIKIFRRKRFFSSALWSPYSLRFIKNAEKLKKIGIPTITPIRHLKIAKEPLTAVEYTPLAGKTLKDIYLEAPSKFASRNKEIRKFISTLHEKGIYFRSLHLGNIVLTSDGNFGLIDIADMRFFGKPLSNSQKNRNEEHFKSYLKRNNLLKIKLP